MPEEPSPTVLTLMGSVSPIHLRCIAFLGSVEDSGDLAPKLAAWDDECFGQVILLVLSAILNSVLSSPPKQLLAGTASFST